MKKEVIIRSITDVFEKEPHVAAVFLFGSMIRMTGPEPGDIDIAVLYHPAHVPDERHRYELQEQLAMHLPYPVDLVVLNTASPILWMQILKKSQIILNREHTILRDFMMRIPSMYEDVKIVRRPIEKKIYAGARHD